jgi:exosortase A-associated hydrolase 1
LPAAPHAALGVLVVVGGPQYRAGSHRQFVLLCRQLAERGLPTMRFDYRGMGDATGQSRTFESIERDIREAVNVFQRAAGVKRVALWGLCDAASAACFYAPIDERVAGLILLNPWVRTEAGLAKTYLKHYYLRRLFQRSFWSKVVTGGASIRESLPGLVKAALFAVRRPGTKDHADGDGDLPSRMASALSRRSVPMLFVLSGRDYVANEFEAASKGHPGWKRLLESADMRRIEAADHTFSTAEWRDEVAERTAEWVLKLGESIAGPQSVSAEGRPQA